jgi:16S rRNA (guanine527-N7)-methyltransferase
LHVWDRHILDSAQLVRYIDFDKDKSLSDMGSGAGFPGIVLAIFNKNPKFHVKLYDKSNIKCDFLDNIRNKLDVDYDVLGKYQNEEIRSEYVVSRAFKKLEEILRISREIIKVNHKLIILKGKNAEQEINRLQQPLEFLYKLEESITDHESKILIVDVKK